MSQGKWAKVDYYINDLFVPADPALEAALEASSKAGLPPISVTPNQGKLLNLLARVQGSRKILEIGTLGGYSTIWLARALPIDGRLITLEAEPKHAQVARTNIARAGLANIVELRIGQAQETLPKLAAEGLGPFDLTFIDPTNLATQTTSHGVSNSPVPAASSSQTTLFETEPSQTLPAPTPMSREYVASISYSPLNHAWTQLQSRR